jgi:hypothetical protein
MYNYVAGKPLAFRRRGTYNPADREWGSGRQSTLFDGCGFPGMRFIAGPDAERGSGSNGCRSRIISRHGRFPKGARSQY